ncbi:MAG: imidazolonepropionase [Bacilli bacterium]|nr:imidazolonepropionase [Bacilli bacterium]
MARTIIYNIKTLYTPYHQPPVRKKNLCDIKTISNAYIVMEDSKFIAFGENDYQAYWNDSCILIDAKGKICLPGFIDAHTHLVHAGSREDEFALLRKGVPYLDILRSGGGILSTVEATRKAGIEELYLQAKRSLDKMMAYGVVAMEAKSGYGLRLEDELKQLHVANLLNNDHPVRILSTYMGAHAYPSEYKNNHQGYIDSLLLDLEKIKQSKLAQAVDVFCEEGVFGIEETKQILSKAKELGFQVKLHADEIQAMGGAKLGVLYGAVSVDHLMATSDEDIIELSQSNTIANILPGTSFFLGKPYANARKMIDEGVAIAVASDYNPGSCPTENFQLITQLAANFLYLQEEEILHAVTINPAFQLGLADQKGSIEVGKDADLLLLDIPNLSYLFYHFGINHVSEVWIAGKRVI